MNSIARRKLPHIYPSNAIYFITFRLNDSIPQSILKEIVKKQAMHSQKYEKQRLQSHLSRSQISQENFNNYEAQLDKSKYGSCILRLLAVASIMSKKIHEFDKKFYHLICYTIMPNHVHIMVDANLGADSKFNEERPANVAKWMQMIKGGSAFEINRYLGKKGTLWSSESFDRFIRNEEQFKNVYNYILDNPTAAGLEKKFSELPYQYENLLYGIND